MTSTWDCGRGCGGKEKTEDKTEDTESERKKTGWAEEENIIGDVMCTWWAKLAIENNKRLMTNDIYVDDKRKNNTQTQKERSKAILRQKKKQQHNNSYKSRYK